jgi:hypothetical protein
MEDSSSEFTQAAETDFIGSFPAHHVIGDIFHVSHKSNYMVVRYSFLTAATLTAVSRQEITSRLATSHAVAV